ncbi:hypothetical protein [Aedoeadaptatus pacaensis]|uniref:hypothetical protein n=1 Tax=Aedoeadaptatus pacaensis TaxID=1776390 RepID=UPI0008397110|nr:hypothetical protein [Peptoniphilus pacaensis]DAL69738.1 MAG TPA: YvrJ protein family protein [Caudoviricetes sp.]
MLELYQPIVNFGVLVVIAAMYLWQTPKTIEKITKVIESNTSVIKDSKTYHERMEAVLAEMRTDVEMLKESKNYDEIHDILIRIEGKVDSLGK